MRFFSWLADLSQRPYCWVMGQHRTFDESDGVTRCALCGKELGRWR